MQAEARLRRPLWPPLSRFRDDGGFFAFGGMGAQAAVPFQIARRSETLDGRIAARGNPSAACEGWEDNTDGNFETRPLELPLRCGGLYAPPPAGLTVSLAANVPPHHPNI